MGFSSPWFTICFLFGFTMCAELPFQCPYKVPKDSPQPSSTGMDGGGLFDDLGLDTNTTDVYGQYRAALSLVPCDSQSISVFTTPFVNKTSTVSVIFVYDNPVDDLKKWLEEKYYAASYENPIVDAVAKQCPKIAEEQASHYAERLTGAEILNIICEESCEKLVEVTPNECPKVPSDACEIADCSKQRAAELCPDSCSKVEAPSYSTEAPTHPTSGPIYYKPYPSQTSNTNLRNKRDTGSATSRQSYSQLTAYPQYHQPATYDPQYQQYPQPATHAPQYQQYPQPPTHAPQYQQYPQYEYTPKIRFDDAPEIVYGIVSRTREFFDCNEPGQDCEELEHYGKVVECKIPRFSPCQSEWLDCVAEDEKYLRTRTEFYEECDIVEDSGTILKAASDNTCVGPRRCVNGQSTTDDLPHVGHDPFDDCTCSAKKSTVSNPYTTENRHKRQVNEGLKTTATNTRVLRAANGGKRKVVDTTLQDRQTEYTEANRIATNTNDPTLNTGLIG